MIKYAKGGELIHQGMFTYDRGAAEAGYDIPEEDRDTVIYFHINKVLGGITPLVSTVLPGCAYLLIMSTALTCAGIMVAEAGLSFLGLGDPTLVSWGKMLADAQSGVALLFGHWWWVFAPGIGIFLSVFAFMRIGLALEEILPPDKENERPA
ncbi:MAG: hypothetical protein LBS19_11040 [Clostridiales bacterium]|jgi:ABC-type dipeptide/oligopeptide/nickel transport system permease subunit|nr:hypothetical protein [Clostridiales bacterium]